MVARFLGAVLLLQRCCYAVARLNVVARILGWLLSVW